MFDCSRDIDDDITVIPIPVISSTDSQKATTIYSTNDSFSASSNLYNAEQLKNFLTRRDQRFRVVFNDSKQKLASWWRSFGFVAIKKEDDKFETMQNFIACTNCFHTFRYGKTSGTKHFIEHADRCNPLSSSGSTQITDHPNSAQKTLTEAGFRRKSTLTTKDKNELNNLCAKWICQDLRPFTVLEDHGFKQLVKSVLRIGADYGNIDTEEFLPSRHTVRRRLNVLADKYRVYIKEELIEPLQSKAVTIAPDFWLSKNTKQSFLGLSATYVDRDFEYKHIDLFCRPFNGIKSSDLVLEALITNLSDFGINSLMDVNIISDRGSNFVKAFSDYDPIYCFGHRLNNVLKVCFFEQQSQKKKQNIPSKHIDPSTSETSLAAANLDTGEDGWLSASESDGSDCEEEIERRTTSNNTAPSVVFRSKNTSTEIAKEQKMLISDIPSEAKHVLFIIKQVKKLVKYVKVTGLNQEIKSNGGGTLHQSTIVRWLSLTDLLESVIKSFTITRKLLIGKAKQQLIIDLNLQYMKQLCIVLRPFKHIITCVQKGTEPSLHLVSMSFITLKATISSFESVKNYIRDHVQEKEKKQLFDDSDDVDLGHELPGIRWFRERLLALLKEMIILDMRHITATFLHPRYKSLKKIPDQIKDQCYKYVRQQVVHIRAAVDLGDQLQGKSSEPEKKKLKMEGSIFTRFESGNSSSNDNMNHESGDESEE